MSNSNITLIAFFLIAHLWLVVRYVAKAVSGNVYNYNILKLLLVFFLPLIGYLIIMKKDAIPE